MILNLFEASKKEWSLNFVLFPNTHIFGGDPSKILHEKNLGSKTWTSDPPISMMCLRQKNAASLAEMFDKYGEVQGQ